MIRGSPLGPETVSEGTEVWFHNTVNVVNATECSLQNASFYIM